MKTRDKCMCLLSALVNPKILSLFTLATTVNAIVVNVFIYSVCY